MYVPPKVVSNHDLSTMFNTSDEWIVQRTGIQTRHYAEDGQGASDLGYEAACQALDAAGVKAHELDLILFATLSPDVTFPGSS
jgi:3-oxoacyl-[acyl-carrier-protein] synthase-3